MSRPLHVEWAGTYERSYPRTRVLIEGLRAHGVRVTECHRPVWERTRHKAAGFLAPGRLVPAAGGHAAAWASIAVRPHASGPVDAVVAGYPAQPDALPAWALARARHAPLVVDMMISLSDTLAGDRARVGATAGAVLAGIDRITLALADIVLADTAAGADFLAERFGVPRDRLVVALVGAEPGMFPPSPPPTGPPRVLWYGKLAPLHGLQVIVDAARMPGVPAIRLVGEGQLSAWLANEIRRDRPAALEHIPWIPYDDLGAEVASSAVVLGVFGTSAKAARVVPNKVFQAMAAARPVVTAATPGAREVLSHDVNAVLVPPGDPVALAAALRELAADAPRRARLGEAARERYEQVGLPSEAARPLLNAILACRG